MLFLKNLISIQIQDSVQIVTTLNSNGRPYKVEKKFYNHLGYLKNQTKLLISNKTKYELYHYNDRGFLKVKTIF